jgi:hypothetical protein
MTFRKLALPFIVALCAVPLAGCPAPNKDAIAINAVGTAFAIVATNDGDVSGAADAIKISGQLATAIQNFVPGSPVQNIVQLGGDLVAIIQADSNSKAADEIAILANLVLNTISEYNAPPTTAEGVVTAIAHAQVAPYSGPRTKAELYAVYNAALAAHPVSGLKRLK